MKRNICVLMAVFCGSVVLAPVLNAAPTVQIKKNAVADMPEIWKSVPTAKRLQYVRAAELDATRILAERIMGISLDGKTTVKNLAAADDTVKGVLAATLKGVKTVGSPTYHEDGRVEVIRAVKTRTLVESVVQKLGSKSSSVVRETVTAEIDALGNAAIPGSDGHARVMAKRAAELDVYRRLSERVAGVTITADSTLRDFAVENDEIKAGMASFRGVDRRFDFKIKNDKVVYLSDYAHHPEEIKQSILSMRALYADKKLTGVFQPHLYTRTRDFYQEFADSLSLLDEVILTDIYPARELPIEGVSSQLIYDNLRPNIEKTLCKKEEVMDVLKNKHIEVLMTLGAGDIENYAAQICEILNAQC